MGVRHGHEGDVQEGQGGDSGVLQEGLPRAGHHQHRGEQPLRQGVQLVQAGPEEVQEWQPAVGQAVQMSR